MTPSPERPDWAFILAAQALPLAATLRGCEVFHAAGVVLGRGAALFAGAPGAGKSSLAAALLRRGATLLERRRGGAGAARGGDRRPPRGGRRSTCARPSTTASPPARATPSALRGLRRPPALPPGPVAGDGAVRRRCSCSSGRRRGSRVEPLAGADPFELLAATFNLSVRTPERLTRQLDMVEALVASGGVFRLRVLPGTDPDQLATVVETHLLAGAR